jgi:hypothetical protein
MKESKKDLSKRLDRLEERERDISKIVDQLFELTIKVAEKQHESMLDLLTPVEPPLLDSLAAKRPSRLTLVDLKS